MAPEPYFLSGSGSNIFFRLRLQVNKYWLRLHLLKLGFDRLRLLKADVDIKYLKNLNFNKKLQSAQILSQKLKKPFKKFTRSEQIYLVLYLTVCRKGQHSTSTGTGTFGFLLIQFSTCQKKEPEPVLRSRYFLVGAGAKVRLHQRRNSQ